ncbi:MAG: Crp/Fnr family transcriptional regulator [Leptospiraceae bacterium]|nr:Crp/Fnr family transcriptional regulator [Leptospiraceae bacterium]
MGLFEKPSMELILNLFKRHGKFSFQKGEFLFHEGEEPKYADLLIEGRVQIFKYDASFNEITLNFFSPISLIAEWAVINQLPYPASARFLEKSQIYRMTIEDLKKHLNENLPLNQYFIYSLSEKIKVLNMTIDRGLTMDAYQRVLHFLYFSPESLLELQQTQIASLLCLRPETLSRVLKVLKAKRMIRMEKGKIIIINKQAIEKDIDEKFCGY